MSLNVVFNTWVFLGFLLTKSGLNSKSHVATLLTEIRSKDYLIVCDVKCPINVLMFFWLSSCHLDPNVVSILYLTRH